MGRTPVAAGTRRIEIASATVSVGLGQWEVPIDELFPLK
jgi:hypothetical protein